MASSRQQPEIEINVSCFDAFESFYAQGPYKAVYAFDLVVEVDGTRENLVWNGSPRQFSETPMASFTIPRNESMRIAIRGTYKAIVGGHLPEDISVDGWVVLDATSIPLEKSEIAVFLNAKKEWMTSPMSGHGGPRVVDTSSSTNVCSARCFGG